MYRPIPTTAHKVNGARVSPWTPVPDADYCAMRYLEGTDPNEVSNRVAFIEKTPRVRIQPFTSVDDWKNWHGGWKGDEGHDPVAQGWCDTHLLAMGYVVPEPLPYDDSMLR